MQMALVSAVTRLRNAVGQSGVRLVSAEFERAPSFAVGCPSDLILVACAPIRDALKIFQRLLGKRSTRTSPISFLSVDGSTIKWGFFDCS